MVPAQQPLIWPRKMLIFDIDLNGLQAVAAEIGASEKQYKASLSRACSRTAATLRKMSATGLKNELQLRTLGVLRKRLKTIRIRGRADGVGLWYGLNDMPVSALKGRPRNTKTGAKKNNVEFEGGFVGKTKAGKATIFKRAGKARLPIREQTMGIKDRADVFIEDEIFTEVERIFWHHYEQDIRRRVKYLETSERWK